MPPPSSGGTALIEMMNMMENANLDSIKFNSTAYVHLIAEVMRRAFADRAEYLGDPDFDVSFVNGISKLKVDPSPRIEVRKTYKLYIDGKFPRTESGRFTALKDNQGNIIANFSRASRKDLRDAIVSNRKAQNDWAKRSAYNKAQILYRIAERDFGFILC